MSKAQKQQKHMKVSKNSKYQTHEKPKRPDWRARCPLARVPGTLKGGTLPHFLTSIVAKHQKIEGETLWWKKFRKKYSHNAKKTERGDPLGFFNIHSVPKHQKIEGGPVGNFFRKKSHNAEKTKRGAL